MRVVFANCSVDYSGRLDAHLDLAPRLLMLKADGSLLIHSDGGSYKPLNWMSAPCSFKVKPPQPQEAAAGITEIWRLQSAKSDDQLVVYIHQLIEQMEMGLGRDPGLVKDGVEAHLQKLLAEQVSQILGPGYQLARRLSLIHI